MSGIQIICILTGIKDGVEKLYNVNGCNFIGFGESDFPIITIDWQHPSDTQIDKVKFIDNTFKNIGCVPIGIHRNQEGINMLQQIQHTTFQDNKFEYNGNVCDVMEYCMIYS